MLYIQYFAMLENLESQFQTMLRGHMWLVVIGPFPATQFLKNCQSLNYDYYYFIFFFSFLIDQRQNKTNKLPINCTKFKNHQQITYGLYINLPNSIAGREISGPLCMLGFTLYE